MIKEQDALDYVAEQFRTRREAEEAARKAHNDAVTDDARAWFEAAYRVSGTGFSRIEFIKKYQHHLGVDDDVAARMVAALKGLSP